MNEQEPVNDVVSKGDVVKTPGGQTGMLVTRPSGFVIPASAAIGGIATYLAIEFGRAAVHGIGFTIGVYVAYRVLKAYRRTRRHDES